jgi:hypothetical protein
MSEFVYSILIIFIPNHNTCFQYVRNIKPYKHINIYNLYIFLHCNVKTQALIMHPIGPITMVTPQNIIAKVQTSINNLIQIYNKPNEPIIEGQVTSHS